MTHGNQAEFIDAWKGLGQFFLSLPTVESGSLFSEPQDPSVYYAFGPWPNADVVTAMRTDWRTAEANTWRSEMSTNESRPPEHEDFDPKQVVEDHLDYLISRWEQYRYVWRAWIENQNDDTKEALDDARREIAKSRRKIFEIVRKVGL